MKIGYAKWSLTNTLILAILWTLIGIFQVWEFLDTGTLKWHNALFIALGPIYIFYYLHQKGRKYIQFDDERIVLSNFPPKTIYLADLQDVHYAVGDYHFISKNGKKIVVNKESMDPEKVSLFHSKFELLKERIEHKKIKQAAILS